MKTRSVTWVVAAAALLTLSSIEARRPGQGRPGAPGQHVHHRCAGAHRGSGGAGRRLRHRLGQHRAGRQPRTASSASATTVPARRGAPSSRSTPSPPASSTCRRSRSTRRATSSSSGESNGPGRVELRRLRPALRRRRQPARGPSSRSTPTPRATRATPRVGMDAAGRLRGGLGQRRPGRRHLRTASSASASTPPAARSGAEFQVNTYTTGDQETANDGHRRRRQLRRGVGEHPGRRPAYGIFGQRFDAAGRPAGRRVPGQHLHHRRPARARGRHGRRRQLRRRLGERRARRRQRDQRPQRFDAAGTVVGRRVPGQHLHHQHPVRLRAWPSTRQGNFVVAWDDYAATARASA